MFDENEIKKPLAGLEVQDGVVMIQCIGRLLEKGLIGGNEVSAIASTRDSLIKSIEKSTDKNFDQEAERIRAEFMQKQAEAARAQAEPVEEVEAEA